MNIRVSGERVPKPIQAFEEIKFTKWIKEKMEEMKFKEPTAI